MFGASTSGYIYGSTNGRYMTFIDGKIGIGTNSPDCKTHINTALTSNTVPILKLTENGSLNDRRLLWALSTNMTSG